MAREYIPKEVSWLSFNGRVLQEAADPSVPLLNRIKFLGIYSSNLDEFFEVRVATLKRLAELEKDQIDFLDESPKKVLKEVEKIVIEQRVRFTVAYQDIIGELGKKNIHLIDEKKLREDQLDFIRDYFRKEVRPKIFPIRMRKGSPFPTIIDKSLYLAVRMYKKEAEKKYHYCFIQIPTDILPRFVQLPSHDKNQYLIFIDDIIRFGLRDIFANYDWDTFEAYEFKLNRDAELDIAEDFSETYISKINKSLKKRKQGNPVRLSYDEEMPKNILEFIKEKLELDQDDTVIPGRRYQNSKDLMKFPDIIREKGENYEQTIHRDLAGAPSVMAVIAKKDVLLHFPYQSFDYVIDLLREASIDSRVTSIKITLYRVAKNSGVINALINARKNNIDVTVILELQARFDEEANINWANRLQEEGIRVIFGVQGLKVHSKMCMITRKEKVERGKETKNYCIIGTGNFNEFTAQIYTDHFLFTSNKIIADEVAKLFEFFESPYKLGKFRHLVVSPFNLRKKIWKLIDREIANAAEGKDAWIDIKINNLADAKVVAKLYKASAAGVRIRIIGRSMFSVVAAEKNLSDNIEAISIVDKYLEHDRVYIFCNEGDPLVFISSADWLPRNFDKRIEVTCPVYDDALKDEIRSMFDISWHDNVRARILTGGLENKYRKIQGMKKIRSQVEILEYLKNLHLK